MIQRIRKNLGTIARFGSGTIQSYAYLLKSRIGGQIELTHISKTRVGTLMKEDKRIYHSPKIVLDFKDTKSIDILVQELLDLKDMMLTSKKSKGKS